ncbi:MAG TPA: carboxymuconolactone decarboxylase family protein [Gammaproteobacteria bacterium]|nr:carboxymuconolactone decarboxylase family protein [Gammaproteobacteria bacterium]
MSLFTQHTDSTAPATAAAVLGKVRERYGFIPNLAAYVAESPVTLDAVMNLAAAFDQTSLTPQEQQVVLLTVSALNGCSYCKTVHTALGRGTELDAETLRAIVALEPLKDARLTALRDFTRQLVEEQGWVNEEGVQRFLAAGFSQAQVFEVVLGIAMKTLTNYSNHLAGATPNPEFIAMAEGEAAA